MRWKSAGDPEGMRVKKLSTRFSGRLPTTFSSASALPISRATYPEKLACTASEGLPASNQTNDDLEPSGLSTPQA